MIRTHVAAAVTAALLVLPPGGHAVAEDVLIKAARVYTLDGVVLEPGNVIVSNGKITSVGEQLEAPGARVIEVETLMPGLVDAYSQAGLSGQTAEYTREITPALHASSAIDWESRDFVEQLSDGTTCLHVTPGTDNVISGLSCLAKTAGDPTERLLPDRGGLVLTMCSDPASRNRSRSRPDSIFVRQPTNRMGVIWMLRSTFHQAKTGGGGPLVTDQYEFSGKVVTAALQGESRIYGVSRTHYDANALLSIGNEFGFTPIVVGGQEAWKITDELAAARTTVILTPTRPGADSGSEDTRLCANNAGKLYEAGVPFCISGGQLLDQARFAVRAGLKPEAALDAITVNPARVLGLDGRLGKIAAGQDADLIAMDGEPLEFTTSVDWVMVNGTVQYKAGD